MEFVALTFLFICLVFIICVCDVAFVRSFVGSNGVVLRLCLVWFCVCGFFCFGSAGVFSLAVSYCVYVLVLW